MLYGWIKLFGISEIATRSLSLVIAVCSIVSYYKLGCRFFSPFIVFLSGFVLMLNPLFLTYSIETRSYSLLVLLAILATDLFIRVLDRKSPLLFLLYGLSLSASIYTHYFGVLILPVHALGIFLWKRWPGSLKYLLATWFLVVVSVSPLAVFRPSSVDQVDWMTPPTIKTAIMAIPHLFGSIGIAILVMGLWFYYRTKEPLRLGRTEQNVDLLALLWIFLPVGLAYIVSVMVKPVFMDRYFLGSLPATALLTAYVLAKDKIANWRVQWLLFLLLAIQMVLTYGELNRKGSGFDGLTAYIGRHATEKDMVIAYPFFRADHFPATGSTR
jgi:mannosyltransferase